PIFLYCKRIFSRPSFVKSMTPQEKTRYNELLNME
ncbi:starvation protein A, partial [Acinetobacter baumannii]|nr:starvation protein A [Acinetobacter baumannii]